MAASVNKAEDIETSLTVSLSSFVSPPFGDEAGDDKIPKTDLLVSISAPPMGARPPTDVCCVVDVSGSMGVECTNGDSESQGLSVLAVVKHACKTIVHSLTPQDRFTLVKYSTNAEVVLRLTNINAAGLKMAELAIDALEEGGQTNLWDGLLQGLKSLEDDSGRMKAVLLLTDGQPNIMPPRGIVPMFKQYKESNSLVCTVSTFGFGYNLDSKLLEELAAEGQGMYAFIPDGSFVGTAFVNATSNILSTAARQVVAKVSGLSDLSNVTTPGLDFHAGADSVVTKASWGLQVPLGAVMFGQSKDFIVSVPTALLPTIVESIRVDVDYMQSGSTDMQIAFAEGIATSDDVEVMVQGMRLRTLALIRTLGKSKSLGNDLKKVTAISLQMKEVASLVKVGDERLNDLIKDLDGQITEAISREDWYRKWGRHYLPSLAIAHSLQQCHNFKDPGVQHYGGPLFKALRETAEAVFVKLPPPKAVNTNPYANYGGGGGGGGASSGYGQARGSAAPAARAAPAPVDMSAYYNRGGGCFTGTTLVTMGDGITKKTVEQLVPGDCVQTFRQCGQGLVVGCGAVKFVTQMQLSTPALLVTLPGGLQLTAWHPVYIEQDQATGSGGAWVFPATLAAHGGVQAEYHPLSQVDSVFNMALEDASGDEDDVSSKWHGVILDGVPTITLGHGIVGDAVASHAYYGTNAVIEDMLSLNDRDSLGRVIVAPPPVVADEECVATMASSCQAELISC